MSFSYDLSSDVGKVRLLVPDGRVDAHIFEDEEISAFLVLESGIKRAASLALETIASDQALVLKVIKILDLTTDGAKVSDALLARAKLLRGQAGDEEETAIGDSFAIVGWVVDRHTLEQAYLSEHWGLY